GDAAAVTASARKYPLQGAATSIAPWESVYQQLSEYRDGGAALLEESPELLALKQELCRMMIGSHPKFNRLADRYLRLEDLFRIRDRLVGSGRIGGKAAGMLVARRILLTDPEEDGIRFSEVLEDHDSFYIGSDVFFTFLVNNDLFRLRLHLTRDSHFSREEFAEVERRFLAGKFPPSILEQFRNMLDYFGQAPIIVRSSSLLEDSFGNAFAGKYRSEFCVNQGAPEERMKAFLSAVKSVYASALNPDALSYRRRRGLGETDEQMAILVQRVSGMPYGNYFFPTMAGVAFSRNLYAWNSRIDPSQGIIRLVFGLGTRAVERVGGDYPRMIAVSHPQLRPEIGPKIARYSQHQVDLLDLEANRLITLSLPEVLAGLDYPHLHLLVSTMKDGFPYDPISPRLEGSAEDLVLTFNHLISRTQFVKILGAILSRLERVYGHPVDIEFTASLDPQGRVRVNLLQCRPLFLPGSSGPVSLPTDLPSRRVLFRSQKMISGGVVPHIRYLLYIDPDRYSSIPSLEIKKGLGRVVGRINGHPRILEGKILMMGPGRWGSNNIDLGVNVGYADINNASVLVEIAREEAGHVPEVSYGTHFFQDLVENQIIYLPVYPDDPAAGFNGRFLESSPNLLTDLLPDASEFEDFLHLIDVFAATGGKYLQVVADPQAQEAVCYLESESGGG
ncbi:MAG: PEP/pyruvate-binding domain-containing protein, partial [candidate division NC10 bacterium]|nr:PEP/pyruvate-binding domain-containing protein [candidate division NC10 bacterium]